jgi:hypothetical protein
MWSKCVIYSEQVQSPLELLQPTLMITTRSVHKLHSQTAVLHFTSWRGRGTRENLSIGDEDVFVRASRAVAGR